MISCWREMTVRTPPTPPDAAGEKISPGFILLHVRRLQSYVSITFVEIRQRATGSSGINNRHHLQIYMDGQYIF